MDEVRRMVVVGCSGCGALTALTAKKLDPSLDVTIIREHQEKGLLTRCATPYICCGDVLVDPSYKDDSMFADRGIKLVNVQAVGIDRKSKVVTAADGSTYPYDKLVLATGARPVIPRIPGADLPGVFTLRTSGDAVNILHWVNARRVRKVVLIGAGAIGIEEAYLLSRRGMRVTLVEMLAHVMPTTLDADMSELVQNYMQEKGVELRLKERAGSIEGTDGVETVRLTSGEVIDAGMVLISTGARCNVELAQSAGLERGELGLKVNKYLQTSDQDVYAGGDLVEYPSHVSGRPTLGQLRPNAVIAGRVIAKNILGYQVEFPPLINAFCTKFFDKCIAAAGISAAEAEKAGIQVVAVEQTADSMHSMMRDRKPYVVKLVFDRDSQKIIGGQIVGDSRCPVRYIDVIALAIRCGLTTSDLATFRGAGQPELSPDPGKEPIALAADMAFHALNTT